MGLYESMTAHLNAVSKAGLRRTVTSKRQNGSKIIVDAKEYVNLSSNDYLGLASNLELSQNFFDSLSSSDLRMSSSGSPLLTGAHKAYDKAALIMEELFNKKALFFNSGFAANSGVIAALSDEKTLIVADKLSHASMIDGMSLSKGKCLRYRHNDYEHLERIIVSNKDLYDSIIVVTEAVFSMDGDRCSIDALCALKKKYKNLYLYIDEAHSFCLFNDNGAGLCALSGHLNEVDFILTTFGKGLGSQGACLLCSETSRDYLINVCRSLIFSTALAPLSFLHNAFMIEYMQKHNEMRERLHSISSFIQNAIDEKGICHNVSESQIIPLIVFENQMALEASAYFREKGFYAMPIRHPTVPKGQARLRLSLTASLSDGEVELLKETIRDFIDRFMK